MWGGWGWRRWNSVYSAPCLPHQCPPLFICDCQKPKKFIFFPYIWSACVNTVCWGLHKGSTIKSMNCWRKEGIFTALSCLLFSVYPCFYSQPPPLTPGLSPWGSRFISPSLHSCQEALQDGSQPQPNNNPHCHKQRLESPIRPLLSTCKHAEGMFSKRKNMQVKSSFFSHFPKWGAICLCQVLVFQEGIHVSIGRMLGNDADSYKGTTKKLDMVCSYTLSLLYMQCSMMQHLTLLHASNLFIFSFYYSKISFYSSVCMSFFPTLIPCDYHKELWMWGWLPYIWSIQQLWECLRGHVKEKVSSASSYGEEIIAEISHWISCYAHDLYTQHIWSKSNLIV